MSTSAPCIEKTQVKYMMDFSCNKKKLKTGCRSQKLNSGHLSPPLQTVCKGSVSGLSCCVFIPPRLSSPPPTSSLLPSLQTYITVWLTLWDKGRLVATSERSWPTIRWGCTKTLWWEGGHLWFMHLDGEVGLLACFCRVSMWHQGLMCFWPESLFWQAAVQMFKGRKWLLITVTSRCSVGVICH